MAEARQKDKLAERILEREEAVRGTFGTWHNSWQTISRYLLPRSASFTEEVSEGIFRTRHVLDSTGPRALELFAAFLHTLLNNPATDWFKFSVTLANQSPGQALPTRVKQWREDTVKGMLEDMASRSVNLYQHLHEVYLDEGAFGNAVLFLEDRNGVRRARAFHLTDCVFEENEAGFVDVMLRQFRMTPRQAMQRFDEEKLPAELIKMAKGASKKGNDKSRFIHAVLPGNDPLLDGTKAARRGRTAAFVSIWIDAERRQTMEIGTYQEFPYMVPRWVKARNEAAGRGPGMKVLPDVLMANRMKETILRGAEKLVDPPLIFPDGSLASPVRMFPGGMTFTEGQVRVEPLIPPGASRIEMGDQQLFQVQRAIERGFFVQLFQTEDSPVKTATQVLQESDERNRAVSPMLIRQQAELHSPLVFRYFNMMRRAGALPDTPPEVEEASQVRVEYVSPLTGSQRQLDALSIMRLVESLAPFVDIDPGIFDWIDPDKTAIVLHGAHGAPASILREEGAVKRVRRARQEQQAAQQQQETTFAGADAAAKLISASSKGRQQ